VGRFFLRHGISFKKKSLYAAEQQHADVARARRRWIREQAATTSQTPVPSLKVVAPTPEPDHGDTADSPRPASPPSTCEAYAALVQPPAPRPVWRRKESCLVDKAALSFFGERGACAMMAPQMPEQQESRWRKRSRRS
jgi:hypothetical protein